MLINAQHAVLTAAMAYAESLFSLRGRCSEVLDDLAVSFVLLSIEPRTVEREETDWQVRIAKSGTMWHHGYPVEVHIEFQEHRADLRVALDPQAITHVGGDIQDAVRALDQVLSDLDQLITSTIHTSQVSNTLHPFPAAVPQALPS